MKFRFVCIYSILISSGLKEVPESVGGWCMTFCLTHKAYFPSPTPSQ